MGSDLDLPPVDSREVFKGLTAPSEYPDLPTWWMVVGGTLLGATVIAIADFGIVIGVLALAGQWWWQVLISVGAVFGNGIFIFWLVFEYQKKMRHLQVEKQKHEKWMRERNNQDPNLVWDQKRGDWVPKDPWG